MGHTHPGWGDGGRGLDQTAKAWRKGGLGGWKGGRSAVGFRAQRTPGQIQVPGAGLFRQEAQAAPGLFFLTLRQWKSNLF